MTKADQSRARTRLLRAIAASGLSNRQFALTVLLRDERSLRRWLAGDAPIPKAVREWLEREAHHVAP